MSPRRKNHLNIRVKEEVGPDIAERIKRLHHAHQSQNNTRKLRGGRPLVMPSSNVWDGNAELFRPEEVIKDQRQKKTLQWADSASWLEWPDDGSQHEFGEKENGPRPESPATAADMWKDLLESRQDDSPMRQRFSPRGSEVSEASMHRRVSQFVDRVSRLSAPIGASRREISELDHIVGMVNQTFSPGRKDDPRFDKQTIKDVAIGSGLPMQVIEDILDSDKDGSGDDDHLTHMISSSSSSNGVSGFMKALWEGSHLNEEVRETITAPDWERALGVVTSSESDPLQHLPGGIVQLPSNQRLRGEETQPLSSTPVEDVKSEWDAEDFTTSDEFSRPSVPSYLSPNKQRNAGMSGRLGISKRIDVFQDVLSPQGSQVSSSVAVKEQATKGLGPQRNFITDREDTTERLQKKNQKPKRESIDEKTVRKDRTEAPHLIAARRPNMYPEEPRPPDRGHSTVSRHEVYEDKDCVEDDKKHRQSRSSNAALSGQHVQDVSHRENDFQSSKSVGKNGQMEGGFPLRGHKKNDGHSRGQASPHIRLGEIEPKSRFLKTRTNDQSGFSRFQNRSEQPHTLQKKHSYPGCEPRHTQEISLTSSKSISRKTFQGRQARKREGREPLPRQSSEPIMSRHGGQRMYRFKGSKSYVLPNLLEIGSELSEVFDGIQENSVESHEVNQAAKPRHPLEPPPPPPSPPEVIQTFSKRNCESSLYEDSDPSSCSGIETYDDETDNVTETVSAITSCNETSIVTANALHDGACSPKRISGYFPPTTDVVDCSRGRVREDPAFQKKTRSSLASRDHKKDYWQPYSAVKTLGSFDSVSVINESVTTNGTPKLTNGPYLQDAGLHDRMATFDEYRHERATSFAERIPRTETDGGHFHAGGGIRTYEIHKNRSYGGYPLLHERAPFVRVPSFGPKRDPNRFIRHDPRRPKSHLDHEIPQAAADNLLYVMGPLLSGDTADESLETLGTDVETKANQSKKSSKFCSLVCGDFDLSIALSGCCKK